MVVEVSAARSNADRDAFLRLPWKLYGGMRSWVPNPLLLQRDVINEKKNPFFGHAEAELFLARREGEVVGRISGSVDRDHNSYHNEKTGFFGFFECIDDLEVAQTLLDTAEGWARQKGMGRVRGPLSFSLAEEAGLMIEGFEEQAMIAVPQSLPYYQELIESAGYEKAMDLLGYRWQIQSLPERMMDAIEKTRAQPGLTVRKANPWRLRREVDILLDIYNDAWNQNWGYVEITEREAAKLAADLRLIVDKNIVLIAEVDGEPAGMVVALPNLYEATRDFNGYLDPLKAAKLVWRLKLRGVETGRIMLFGVKKKFQTRQYYGLPYLLLQDLYEGASKSRYVWCEQSWVLENNGPLNALMPHWGAEVYKRWRIYEKAL